MSVLQQVDQGATDLDLSFKPSKCGFYLFDGQSHQKGIQLLGGFTRSVTEGGTKVLGKSLVLSLSATKAAAKNKLILQYLKTRYCKYYTVYMIQYYSFKQKFTGIKLVSRV